MAHRVGASGAHPKRRRSRRRLLRWRVPPRGEMPPPVGYPRSLHSGRRDCFGERGSLARVRSAPPCGKTSTHSASCVAAPRARVPRRGGGGCRSRGRRRLRSRPSGKAPRGWFCSGSAHWARRVMPRQLASQVRSPVQRDDVDREPVVVVGVADVAVVAADVFPVGQGPGVAVGDVDREAGGDPAQVGHDATVDHVAFFVRDGGRDRDDLPGAWTMRTGGGPALATGAPQAGDERDRDGREHCARSGAGGCRWNFAPDPGYRPPAALPLSLAACR